MPERLVNDVLRDEVQALDGFETAELDAAVLLAFVLGRSRAWLAAHPDEPVPAGSAARFRKLVTRRAAHAPIAYLTGSKEFYGRGFRVSGAVLVPRPETERLLELVLERVTASDQVIEVGTGSGCLAISLKLERPSLSITATDISAPALKVAQWNAATLGAEVEFQEVDLNPVLTDPIHSVIVANLPYVPSADAAAPELGHEPVRALDGGTDGFAVIARLLDRLAPAMPRLLFLEIDPSHAPRLLKRFSGQCEIIPDLAGRERFAIISR